MSGRGKIAVLPAFLFLAGLSAWPVAAAEDPLVTAGDLDFQVNIDPTTLIVGKRFTVQLTISYPVGSLAYFPEVPDVHPFVLVGHTSQTDDISGSSGREIHHLTLLPVRVGTSVLKPIEVPYVDPQGQAGSTHTPELRIQVGSSLGDETDPQLAPAGEPVPVLVPNLVLIWTLFGLCVAAVAAAGGILGYRAWRRWQEAHRPPPPPRPPLEVALERLADIEARGLAVNGEFKELALEVSEVVREFLGGCMGFSGVDMTTFEVLMALQGRDTGRATPPELEDFFGFCDLVKFAKLVPSEEEAHGMLPRARDLVNRVVIAYPYSGTEDGEGEP